MDPYEQAAWPDEELRTATPNLVDPTYLDNFCEETEDGLPCYPSFSLTPESMKTINARLPKGFNLVSNAIIIDIIVQKGGGHLEEQEELEDFIEEKDLDQYAEKTQEITA
jgi:hypothetical protein